MDPAQAAEDLCLCCNDAPAFLAFGDVEARQPFLEQSKVLNNQVAHRLIKRSLVKGRERFGREFPMLGVRLQSSMELGRSATEQARHFEVGAQECCYRGWYPGGHDDRSGGR